MIAENARTALKSSRMDSLLTDSAAIASEPMLSGCCSTVLPTTWSTYFACSCLCPCDRRKSKHCAHNSSRSARASGKPFVVSESIWPAAGHFKVSSKLEGALSTLLSFYPAPPTHTSKRSRYNYRQKYLTKSEDCLGSRNES